MTYSLFGESVATAKKKPKQVLSYSEDQSQILSGIVDLHCDGEIHCDATFGNGAFYKAMPPPLLKFDIDPQVDGVVKADSQDLPVDDCSLSSIMFDPPFLTYVKEAREHNDKCIMSRRFGGYYTYQQLEDHYIHSISCFYRKLKRNGVLIVKCQDIVHNHRLHATHVKVILWAESEGFRLKDLFVLGAKHRMPGPNGGTQKHARVAHSYFLVFVKR